MASLRQWTVKWPASASGQCKWPGLAGLGWARTKLAAGLGRPGGIRAGGQDTVELVPGADAELGEHAAEMVLGGAAQPLPVNQVRPGQLGADPGCGSWAVRAGVVTAPGGRAGSFR
jgi:hypothetical protein